MLYKVIVCGMAFTFFKANNVEIHTPLYDDGANIIKDLMSKAGKKQREDCLPVDSITANKFDKNAQTSQATVASGLTVDQLGLASGTNSRKKYLRLAPAEWIVWNGPMGVFTREAFSREAKSLTEAVVKVTSGVSSLS